jgi:hypothetical protein
VIAVARFSSFLENPKASRVNRAHEGSGREVVSLDDVAGGKTSTWARSVLLKVAAKKAH